MIKSSFKMKITELGQTFIRISDEKYMLKYNIFQIHYKTT